MLLVEILARLPPKSIFRFKIVSKHWKTLISHPSFRRFYLSILDSNTNATSLPFRILYQYFYASHFKIILNRFLRPETYNSSESSLVLFLSSFKEREPNFKVLGISNGLILCNSFSSTPFDYYVGDPVTQQWIGLPNPSARSQLFVGEGIITRVNPEDHTLIGFTVVMIDVVINYSDYDSEMATIYIYSSESGKWIWYTLPCGHPIRLLKRGGGQIFCYGAFHWLIKDHGMAAFDPYKEPKSYRLIPLPNDRDLQSERNHYDELYQLCCECQGTLGFFEVSPDPTNWYFLKMWSMKDYEKGEWGCEFKVRRSQIHSKNLVLSGLLLYGGTFLPLSFHPVNANVVYLRSMELGWVVSYDVLSRRMDFACKVDASFEDLSWLVLIPVVLPRWPMLMSIASQPSA